jgi:hypothetical protein
MHFDAKKLRSIAKVNAVVSKKTREGAISMAN